MVEIRMEFEQQDKEIVELLTKLKNAGGHYPKELLASRRQIFLGQVASVGAGIGIGKTPKEMANPVKAVSTPHIPVMSASSLIEPILVVAVVIQAGILVYNYRDKIAEFFNSVTSVSTSLSVPAIESSIPEVVGSNNPTETPIPTTTSSVTPTTIPSLTTAQTDGINASGNGTVTVVVDTPKPNDNNGNHYGQTPKPDRTKEKNDPKPTKEKNDPKPTKEKYPGNGKEQ